MEWPHQSNTTTGGVFLEITEGRSLYFTPRETVIFGYLFDLADTDDDGLVGGADGGHAFLSRARLPPETLQRLWSEAGGGIPDACLGRPQWFVLLALVALAQAGRPCTLRDLLTDPSLAMPAPAAGPLPVHQANGARGNSGGQSSHQHQQGAHLLYHQPQHHHQQNIQQTVHMQLPLQNAQHAHSSQQQQNPVRPRPIPDFFLDGGSPFYPATRTMPPSSRKSQQTSSERGGAEGSLGDWEDASQGLDDVGEDGLEHNQGDDYHLEITVYSHRVVGEGYSSHTEYTVLANASVPGFARRELEVARRFSDFRWLHGCFKALPGVLPPPLPPSKWAGSSSRDFVAERMKGLQRYMTRVAQHPVLRRQYALQVFLEGTPRGLRAAKVLLPGAAACWSDTFSPSPTAVGANLTNPTLSTSPGSTPPDESGSSVRRRFSIGGADEMYGPGGGGVLVGVGGNIRQGQRRSVSFGASSDDSSSGSGGGASGAVVSWTGPGGGEGGAATPWPLSVVATVGSVGYEAYGNYVATSLTSIKGVFGAVKTKARSVVGLVAGPAPIAVEPDPVYDVEVAHVEELVGPLSGSAKIMESAAVLKRGVGYEMSRLGHYLTQVASLEDMDGFPLGVDAARGGGGAIRHRADGGRGRGGDTRGSGVGAAVTVNGGRGGAVLAKAEQVLGQRMERVATAWLEAIDQEESEFLDPLREQLGYLASAKEVHRGRGRALDALQASNASLQRNKQRLHAARAQGDAHAAAVSTAKMEKAEARMTNAQSQAALISKTFKGEAKRFHACRQAEGITAILELARAQAEFARKANAAWKQVLEDINPTDEELRQSQQRVQHPKREVRIGEGKSRSGRGLGSWLGTNPVSGNSSSRGTGAGGITPTSVSAGGGGGGGRDGYAGSIAVGKTAIGNVADGNVAVGGDFREHGRAGGGRGQPHGSRNMSRVSESGNGSGGAVDMLRRNEVFCEGYSEDVANRGRGLGMGVTLELGQGSPADGDPTTRSLWGEEEANQAREVKEVGAQQPHTNTKPNPASTSTTATPLQFQDDWEPLDQLPVPPVAALEARQEGDALASAAGAASPVENDDSEVIMPEVTPAAAVTVAAPSSLDSGRSLSSSSSISRVPPSSSPQMPPQVLSSSTLPSPSPDESEEMVPSVLVQTGGGGGGGDGRDRGDGEVSAVALPVATTSSRGNGSGSDNVTVGISRVRISARQRRLKAKEAAVNKIKVVSSSPAATSPGRSKPAAAGIDAGVTAPSTPSNAAGSAGSAAAVRRPATSLSLMDSLEALSFSGGAEESAVAEAAPSSTGRTGRPIGERKEEYRFHDEDDDDDEGGNSLRCLSNTGDNDAGSYVPGETAAEQRGTASGGSASHDSSSSIGLGTDPDIGSESVSGFGFTTVSAPTTVARLAGSPNPPLRRGPTGKQAGSGFEGGSARAENGLRRLTPNGGRAGRSKLNS